jgi:peptidyl-prolyl cis-trans isomerase A (cyclophilin A)
MKFVLWLVIFLVTLFLGCEDTKKTSDQKVKERPLIQKDSSEIQIQSTEHLYPLITNKNVIDFLTEYGASHPETRATITTNHGAITIRLYEDTPLHRANFVYLVKQEYFNGTFFHRIVKNFIIQGGNSDDVSTPRKRNKIGRKYLIPAEIKPSRNHRYGTVSGAKDYRENPDNKSAPFEFFIFLGPQTSTRHLNGNYTVFGEVIKGMNVVEKIANLPAEDDDWPIQNVYIQNITLQ